MQGLLTSPTVKSPIHYPIGRLASVDLSPYRDHMTDWIAVTGLHRLEPNATHTAIPADVMNDPNLSLEARGLFVLLLSYRGQPIDPYDGAIEDAATIAGAIDELITEGYAARVERSR